MGRFNGLSVGAARGTLSHSTLPEQARAGRHDRLPILPIATAICAAAIFAADTLATTDIALSTLYSAIVLMAARFCSARGTIRVAVGCVALTILSYYLSPPGGPEYEGIVNTVIGFVAIGLATLLVVQQKIERKRAEEERERLDQLEADLVHINRVSMMGELAASLAHEIKQPITGAIIDANACMRWLRRDQPDVAEACNAASRMVAATTRAAGIIDRVRSLYGRGAPEREVVDLNEIVREITVLLGDTAGRHSISIRTKLDLALPRTTADRIQLQQVLMNLMLNGIDAMREAGGELTIASKRTEDGQLFVSVADSGIGLPVGEAERIFEAFFTTKPQGTGMGLSISRRIIEAHGGRLWASPNDGRGTVFQFTLPDEVTAAQPHAV